ncbi:MAG: TRAP transporter fused permease subunit [Hyphomicrobiales bacterium]|nr:TRAP transporter fused permease subunit [Hyphomicrobiales bacterium]MCP4999330.1 TRAP transporter fused permease subunit [Hyphomicrobiales bacterium]
MPGIPGLDGALRQLTGWEWFGIRKFPTEWFYPIAFVAMMVCVALRHSIWKSWSDRSASLRALGLFLDIALVTMAIGISMTYVVEIESICLIDQLTGERERLIAEALVKEKEIAELYGLPEPTSVEDPKCINNTGGFLVLIVGVAVLVFLSYNIKVWGLPLVLVALAVALYTIATVLVWYFHGADDINKYLMTKLAGEPRLLSDGRPKVHDILVNNASGLLGRFLDIMLNTIFPYLVLGSLFGASAGGQSLIKLAFRWTRRLRGGPAHAAIVSSAMFGTISGGPIVNVLSTGVLTIPMMLKRGFSKIFSGGVEAAASSGGSIMPPVMGVAAFVLAALTVVPYSEVIVAAIIPAVAYFFCLFLSVVFQARKQNIEAIGELTEDMQLDGQDRLNLLMIFGPILLILMLLLTTKESVGCGLLGGLFGAERVITDSGCEVVSLSWFLRLVQNSVGDAGSAGWWAVAALLCLLFLDPEVRAKPRKVVDALAAAGVLISTLYLMFLAVSIIDFCLQFTGLPTFISLDVLGWLQSLEIGQDGSLVFRLIALLVTMLIAILLGMGMPAVPAYVNVALLMGPVLAGLGIATFTAHMFIFYFAVASAITPPVALAAFAAATITKAEPMATGFSAVKSGIVMFIIPFVFAIYPEILLIDAAVVDPATGASGDVAYLPGYDGNIAWGTLGLVLLRLILALYLISSALSAFDTRRLAVWEVLVRLGLAALVLFKAPTFFGPAALAALILVGWHRYAPRPAAEAG